MIGTQDLFEMMMRVAISLPQYIPVIGGMEIASAELGGGTVKMWGSVTVLGIIHLGFVYYWDNGEVKFTTSRWQMPDRSTGGFREPYRYSITRRQMKRR